MSGTPKKEPPFDDLRTPRHGDTTWQDNPELYEFKIQLCEILGMSSGTPTWRRDALEAVKQAYREASAYRGLEDVRTMIVGKDGELRIYRENERELRVRRRKAEQAKELGQ